MHFRRELVAGALDRVLFEAVTSQLNAQGVVVKTGTLVDATVITSATSSRLMDCSLGSTTPIGSI